MYSTSQKSIYNWVHRYNSEGIEGLKDRPRCGRPSFLSNSQRSELDQLVQSSPLDHGYSTATWTGALVADLIKNRFGVEYTCTVYEVRGKKAQI